MNKHEIFKEIEENLKEAIALAEKAKQESQDEANRHGGKMQSRYDTFKEEAQYMVTAQEKRIAEFSMSLKIIHDFIADPRVLQISDTIRIGSIIILKSAGGEKKKYLLAPAGGGMHITINTEKILVITPDSPLGHYVIGKKAGEEIELNKKEKTISYKILEVT